MRSTIYEIKKIAMELEKALTCANKMRVEKLLDEMIAACISIKNELDAKEKLSDEITLEKINTIPFIYKPVLKKNYHEGNYLEEFSNMRTSELKDAKALNIHNQFWQNHEVMRGNIFGSLPIELINKEAASRLQRYGWDEVEVDVYEIKKRKCDMRKMVEYCELKYMYFLIVEEKSTGAELLLHYKI